MRNHLALIAVFAAACTGDAGTKDTGATDTGGECPAEDFYTGPVTIDRASVDCNGDRVTFEVDTIGWTSAGYVFTQETGNTEPQYADEHDLESTDYDACGAWDHLERTLDDGSTMDDAYNDWVQNQSTVFLCGGGPGSNGHFGNDQVVTHAFAIDDIDGNQVDCIVGGDDPSGLINGEYERLVDPTFEVSQCESGQVAI